jgi:hypothetical protein
MNYPWEEFGPCNVTINIVFNKVGRIRRLCARNRQQLPPRARRARRRLATPHATRGPHALARPSPPHARACMRHAPSPAMCNPTPYCHAQVLSVDLYGGVMRVSVWFRLRWNDPRLRWWVWGSRHQAQRPGGRAVQCSGANDRVGAAAVLAASPPSSFGTIRPQGCQRDWREGHFLRQPGAGPGGDLVPR